MKKDTIKFIDLFSGIGGFHQGFRNNGYTCVMASEFNQACRDVYQNNYRLSPLGDITKISSEDVPDHDILTAGFPCQPFSICGHKKGFEDTRGTLFFDICRIASEKKTNVLVLENVKHLIHHDAGNTFKTILQSLQALGYYVSFEVLNAINFGVPQNRERLIIIASRIGRFDFQYLKKSVPKKQMLRSFLEPENESMEYLSPSEYTILDNITIQDKSGLIFVGYRNKKTRLAGTRPNTEHLSRVHKQPNRIYSVDGTHPTLPSQEVSGRYFIYFPETGKVRKLTLSECYRIMGFGDSFKIHDSKSEAYKQIGNSVCVPMVEAIAKEVDRQFFSDVGGKSEEVCECVDRVSQQQLQLF